MWTRALRCQMLCPGSTMTSCCLGSPRACSTNEGRTTSRGEISMAISPSFHAWLQSSSPDGLLAPPITSPRFGKRSKYIFANRPARSERSKIDDQLNEIRLGPLLHARALPPPRPRPTLDRPPLGSQHGPATENLRSSSCILFALHSSWGCYYTHLARGQTRVLWGRLDISDVLADPGHASPAGRTPDNGACRHATSPGRSAWR